MANNPGMRIARLLAVLLLLAPLPTAALPDADSGDAASLRTITAWLKVSGQEGYLAAEVADAAGIPRLFAEDLVQARQRGFRSGEVLRVAQAPADAARDFVLFMKQQPGGEVHFYFATLKQGLRKAFVSREGVVQVLAGPAAQAAFRKEISYWQDRIAAR